MATNKLLQVQIIFGVERKEAEYGKAAKKKFNASGK